MRVIICDVPQNTEDGELGVGLPRCQSCTQGGAEFLADYRLHAVHAARVSATLLKGEGDDTCRIVRRLVLGAERSFHLPKCVGIHYLMVIDVVKNPFDSSTTHYVRICRETFC